MGIAVHLFNQEINVSNRIYKVTNSTGDTQAIRANTPAQAIRYAARSEYKAAVATQDDIIIMMSAGAQIQDATKEASE